MPREVGAAILGPGKAGSALVSNLLAIGSVDLRLVSGRPRDAPGLLAAAERGIETSQEDVAAILARDDVELVFDATTARAHAEHAPRLEAAGKLLVDLTPSCAGEAVVPILNLESAVERGSFHLVSSAAQVAVPIVQALDAVAGVEYAEIVATISGAAAGPGTRQNVDELTAGTAEAVRVLGGARESRALIFFGPGGPERTMTTTVFARVREADEAEILAAASAACARLAVEVPGARLTECLLDGDTLTSRIEVGGAEGELVKLGSLAPLVTAATRVGERLSRQLSGAGA
jgi:acetaldehyde dehydrogenase (acetylating)